MLCLFASVNVWAQSATVLTPTWTKVTPCSCIRSQPFFADMSSVQSISNVSSRLSTIQQQGAALTELMAAGIEFGDLTQTKIAKQREGLAVDGRSGRGVTVSDDMADWVEMLYEDDLVGLPRDRRLSADD